METSGNKSFGGIQEETARDVGKCYRIGRGYSADFFVIHEDIGSHAKEYGAEVVIVRQRRRGLWAIEPQGDSHSLWFKKFVQGIQKGMGDDVYQDQVVTLEMVHRLVED